MNEKIILGTAQFGTNYGISNDTGNLLFDQAKKIIDYADEANIKCVDTAIDYHESNDILSRCNISQMKVISKLPWLKETSSSSQDQMINLVESSINSLGIRNYYALLLHRPEQLLTKDRHKVLHFLDLLKNKNLVNKIGISIYDPNMLPRILDLYPFDIVQAPVNILDQRILSNYYIDIIKKKNVSLHARSIFLQGLLLMSRDIIPSQFNKFKYIFDIWQNWLEAHSANPLDACIKFLYQSKEVDHIIVGVQNVSQLIEILKVNKSKIMSLPNWPSDIDERIINPSKWN